MVMSNTSPPSPLVVVSSVSQDGEWLKAFRPHLNMLALYRDLEVWDETDIEAGSDRYQELDRRMKSARIVICFISVDYLIAIREFEAFDYLLEERQRGGLLLLPILIRPCFWEIVPWLKCIQMYPRDKQPVSTHYQGREEEVFKEVVLDVYNRSQEPTLESQTRSGSFRGVDFSLGITTREAAQAIVMGDVVLAAPAEPDLPAGVRENAQRLPETGRKLFGRAGELALLDAAWASEKTNVISLIAWGGIGKTTLVNRWLDRMRADGYRGARRVYAWSFYSQGTKEQVTSSDLFFDETLRWFGAAGFEQRSIWDKAELLADLIRREPTLLVLDGVEPLQSGGDFDHGTFRDGGLQWLLKELIRDNPGLCVVTSRVPLTDYQEDTTVAPATLQIRDDGTIDKYPYGVAVQVNLETISPAAGRDLLKTEFVQGTNAELEQATRDFGCHALAVSLLASWLHEIPGHHVCGRDRIPELDVPEEEGKHARRVLAAFEDLLGESAELELLRIMGLFDRPAQTDLVEAVLGGDTIDGLTLHCGADFRATLASSLERLRRLRLLAPASEHRPNDIDCHPIVREHFAAQLAERLPDGAREAHRRLYEHLKRSAPERPDNLTDMMPLFDALKHGIKAGLIQESFEDVLWARILISDKEKFAIDKLNAPGSVESALAAFSDQGSSTPSAELSSEQQIQFLFNRGHCHRALGRPRDAAEAFRVALKLEVTLVEPTRASRLAARLSQALLTMGKPLESLLFAGKAVEFADSLEDSAGRNRDRYDKRTTLATTFHYIGLSDLAGQFFEEAERLHGRQLEGRRGFKYWVYLIDRNDFMEVRRRTQSLLDGGVFRGASPKLGEALPNLALGMAHLKENNSQTATELFDRAITVLREADYQDYLCRGLLYRAALWRGQFEVTPRRAADDAGDTFKRELQRKAERDLAEAEAIAGRGSMLIWQIEAALERTRLYIAMMNAEGGKAKEELLGMARDKLAEARRLVKQTEKPYEPHAPDWADWKPPEYISVFREGEIVGYHHRNQEIDRLQLIIDQHADVE